jgi:hypothetical protein
MRSLVLALLLAAGAAQAQTGDEYTAYGTNKYPYYVVVSSVVAPGVVISTYPGNGTLRYPLFVSVVNSTTPAGGDITRVSKAGDTMTGGLVISANSFSVGASTIVVTEGKIGIGKTNPTVALDILGHIEAGSQISGLRVQAGGTSGSQYPLIALNQGGTKGLYLRDNGHAGLGDSTPDAQLDIVSDKGDGNFIVSVSSQNDITGNIFGITGDGNAYFSRGSAYASTFTATTGIWSAVGFAPASNTLTAWLAADPDIRWAIIGVCTDCTPPGKLVISTGTAAGQVADAVGAQLQ